MTKIIAYVVGAIILLAVLYHFFGNEGGKVFKAQQKAVKDVHSWHINTQISSNGRLLLNRIQEGNCPDQERIVEYGSEYRRLADDIYWTRNQRTWSQEKVPDDLFEQFVSPRPCMTNPSAYASAQNGIDEYDKFLQEIIDRGSFTKGEFETVGKDACRDWTVQAMNPENRLVAATFCINEQDHLPRKVEMGGGPLSIVTYYEWNVPVNIEKPDLAPVDAAPQAGSTAPQAPGF